MDSEYVAHIHNGILLSSIEKMKLWYFQVTGSNRDDHIEQVNLDPERKATCSLSSVVPSYKS